MAGWPSSTVSPSSPAARTNRSGKAWQSRRRRGLRGTASWVMLLPRLPWWDLVKFHRVRTLPAPAEVNPRAGTERSLPLPSAPSPLGRRQFLISLLLNKDELHHQNVIPFLQYQLVFSSCIYICVTFPGRFVLNSMQQNLSLWLKFYSVHSFHDVAISILFEVCHRHFIFVELSLDITLSQLIQSGPQALSIPHLLFIKLPPLLDKKGINIFNATSRKFEFESSHAEMSMNLKLQKQKLQCPELKVCTKNLLILLKLDALDCRRS